MMFKEYTNTDTGVVTIVGGATAKACWHTYMKLTSTPETPTVTYTSKFVVYKESN